MPGRECFESVLFTKYFTSGHSIIAFAFNCLAFGVAGASGTGHPCSLEAGSNHPPFDRA